LGPILSIALGTILSVLPGLLLGLILLSDARAQGLQGYAQIADDHLVDSSWLGANATPASPDKKLPHLEIGFKIVHKDQADELARQMTNPSSPLYGHGMSTEEYLDRFRPPQREVDQIVQWLRQQGFTVTEADRQDVIFDGTVGQVNAAFHVLIMESADRTRYGNLTDPYIPAAFSDAIGAILGLSNSGGGGPGPVSPASPASDLSPEFSGGTGFGAVDLRNFYNENPIMQAGYTGASSDCAAVIAWSNFPPLTSFNGSTNPGIAAWDETFGITSPVAKILVDNPLLQVVPPFEKEALADVEWIQAAAPTVPIIVYAGDPN